MERNLIKNDAGYNQASINQSSVISHSEMVEMQNPFTFCNKNSFFPIYYIWKKNLVASLVIYEKTVTTTTTENSILIEF